MVLGCEEIKSIVADLLKDPAELQRLSLNTVRLGRFFDWKTRVKDWEEVIEKLNAE